MTDEEQTKRDEKLLQALNKIHAVMGPEYFESIREEAHAVIVDNKERIIQLAAAQIYDFERSLQVEDPEIEPIFERVRETLADYWESDGGYASIKEDRILVRAHQELERQINADADLDLGLG